jgi:hypothetical protein
MKRTPINSSRTARWRMPVAATLLGMAFSISPALAQSTIEADADAILRAMTDQLKGLKSFTADYDVDNEIVNKDGQKLQYSASGKISVSRGAGFLITRQGPFANAQLTFDGKVISLYGKDLNAYVQLDSPGPSFEEATEEFRMATGLDAAGADLLATDPYPLLTEDVVQGVHVGEAYIDGEKCDHLAFRNESVDWQIWISTGEQKLPVKYVITTKWVTGAPQYSLRLKNWDTGEVDPTLFAFKPPADAKKLEQIHTDAVGDVSLERDE